VIDTDPGVDDAIALLVAAASPEVELRAVTTVFGNVSVSQTTENALRILALAGADHIPVATGADRPLVHPQPHRAAHVHGANGLGGVELPSAQRLAEGTPAVRLLADLLHGSSEPVTVCAVGPLTNLALLVATDPAAAARIERLVVMGGAYGSGNVTPTAEFNVWSDPEAAQRVLTSGLPITVVGLDVTRPTAMDARLPRRCWRTTSTSTCGFRAGPALSSMTHWRSSKRSLRASSGPWPGQCLSTVDTDRGAVRLWWIGAADPGQVCRRTTSPSAPHPYPYTWPKPSMYLER
jgi:inosine-uridine nucleoside N-ribohydrolase